MNTEPLAFSIDVSPKGPESVKNKQFKVSEIANELGPKRGCPSYSLTKSINSASLFSFTLLKIIA